MWCCEFHSQIDALLKDRDYKTADELESAPCRSKSGKELPGTTPADYVVSIHDMAPGRGTRTAGPPACLSSRYLFVLHYINNWLVSKLGDCRLTVYNDKTKERVDLVYVQRARFFVLDPVPANVPADVPHVVCVEVE